MKRIERARKTASFAVEIFVVSFGKISPREALKATRNPPEQHEEPLAHLFSGPECVRFENSRPHQDQLIVMMHEAAVDQMLVIRPADENKNIKHEKENKALNVFYYFGNLQANR